LEKKFWRWVSLPAFLDHIHNEANNPFIAHLFPSFLWFVCFKDESHFFYRLFPYSFLDFPFLFFLNNHRYAEKEVSDGDLSLLHTVISPFGEDGVLISAVTLSNLSPEKKVRKFPISF